MFQPTESDVFITNWFSSYEPYTVVFYTSLIKHVSLNEFEK